MRNILIIGFVILNQLVWAQCPTVTVTAQEGTVGNFTFTLSIDYTGASFTNHLSTLWDYDDPCDYSSPTNTATTMTRQYYSVSQVRNPSMTLTFQDPILFTTCQVVVTTPITLSSVLAAPHCPTASMVPMKQSDFCATGDFTMLWLFAGESYDGDAITDYYWTLDYVIWNFGDGTSVTSTDPNSISHSYNTPSSCTITATVYVTGGNGETCQVPMNYIPGVPNGDPHVLVLDPTTYHTQYYTVDPPFASAGLYIHPSVVCDEELISVYNSAVIDPIPLNYNNWSYELFIDGSSVATGSGMPTNASSIYSTNLPEGQYLFEIEYTFDNGGPSSPCSVSESTMITVEECEDTCASCNSFKPAVGEKYWVSAWVKEDLSSQVKTYVNSYLEMEFFGSTAPSVDLYPTGDIIEGWQRVVGSFTIPTNTTDLKINLRATNASVDVFFDDIRVHPFNASMKSYVYDPETLWLTAELDDNNYATFYEYDKEGQLIRVKKETSRGIMTIQESRSSNPKVD